MTDEELLTQCDSILSLIRYRENTSMMTTQTMNDIEYLLPLLRKRTNEIDLQKARAAKGETAGGEYREIFIPIVGPSEDHHLFGCKRCGAVVDFRGTHDEHHKQLDRISANTPSLIADKFIGG